MSSYVTKEQKEKLVFELEELENKLNKTINIKKRMDILESISIYSDILESVYSEYDKLEYYQNLENNYRVESCLKDKKHEMIVKNSIKNFIYDYDFYRELTKKLGKSLQLRKIDLYNIVQNKSLTKSNMEKFMDLVNSNFSKNFSNFSHKEIKNNRLLLTDYSPFGGVCYSLIPFNQHLYYYLCEVSNGITYYDFRGIIHELSHGFINNITIISSLYNEVYSFFNELKLNNIIYKSKEAIVDNQKMDLDNCGRISDMNKNLKSNLRFIRKASNNEYDMNMHYMFYSEDVQEYLISYILGLKLYYQDLEDTELAHYNINKIYKNEYWNIDDINKLEKISKDEILSCEPVKKYIKEINSKWGSLKK